MTIYIILLCYLLLTDAISSLIPEKRRRFFQAIVGGFGLWIVLSLRSVYCGVDLVQGGQGDRNYLWMFENAQTRSFSELLFGYTDRIEPGWMILCKLLSYISDNFIIFLSLIAAIQIFLIGFVLKKTSKDILFSYIVYFCFGMYAFSFSGLRQATSIAITFYASYHLMRGKLSLFVLLVIVAATMHISALLFFIAIVFNRIRYNNRNALTIIIIVLLLTPFLGWLTVSLSSIIFSGRYDVNAILDSGGAYTMFAVYGLLVLLGFRFKDNHENGFMRYMIVMAFAIQSLGIVSSAHLTRIGYFFQMFFLLYFPVFLESYINKRARKFIMFIGSVFFLVFFYLTTKNSPLNVIPYSFLWQIPYN